MKPEGTGTRYVFTALHRDEADLAKNMESGFYQGTEIAVDQLVAHVRVTLRMGHLETPMRRLRSYRSTSPRSRSTRPDSAANRGSSRTGSSPGSARTAPVPAHSQLARSSQAKALSASPSAA